MRGERFAAPAIALLLVFSAVGAGIAPNPVGEARAELLGGGNCTFEDAFLEGVTGGFLYEDNCGDQRQVEELKEEWNATDANETKAQITSQAAQLNAGNKQFLTVARNYGQDSNTIAFSEGEAAAVNSFEGGSNISQAQADANGSIEGYYVTKQKNEIDRWNVVAETIATLAQKARNTSGVSNEYVAGSDNPNGDYPKMGEVTGETRNASVTLLDGSTTNITQIAVSWSFSDNTKTKWLDLTQSSYQYCLPKNTGGNYCKDMKGLHVSGYETTSAQTVLFSNFNSVWANYSTRSQRTEKEVALYINESLGPAILNGGADPSQYVSPSTLSREYAQSYNGSKGYVQAVATAAAAGYSVPDLNETASMTVTFNGSTKKGMIMSQNAPDGGWQSGERYDAGNISGLQMFAVAGDGGGIVELEGGFIVENITGMGGEEIQSAQTVNITYETSNASANYSALQEQIRELNKEIEAREAKATTVDPEDSGPEIPTGPVAIALGAAAIAALLTRE